jgi:hypothetical protein
MIDERGDEMGVDGAPRARRRRGLRVHYWFPRIEPIASATFRLPKHASGLGDPHRPGSLLAHFFVKG